jgi:hypothetical protein
MCHGWGTYHMKIITIAVLSLCLAGCAASTGILPAGPDTYTLSEKFAPVVGGGTKAQSTALRVCPETLDWIAELSQHESN